MPCKPRFIFKDSKSARFYFCVRVDLRAFVGNLQNYKKRLEDYEKFKASNPDFDKQAPEPPELNVMPETGWVWLTTKFWG